MRAKPSISAVMPARDAEASLRAAVEALLRALARACDRYEVLIADAGSTDGTPALADRLAEEHPEVRAIRPESAKGFGAALRAGLAAARLPLVFQVGADGQFDPNQVRLLLDRLPDADIVAGHGARPAGPWWRRARAWAGRRLLALVFGVRVQEWDCPLRLYRRKVFEEVTIGSDGAFAAAEVLIKANVLGYRIEEVPVHARADEGAAGLGPGGAGLGPGGAGRGRAGGGPSVLREAVRLLRRPGLPVRRPA
jgi:glycosyltransferase involved in cell wall biosynthesis